jgi:23S rRNA pseudouridine2605 synthase
LTPKRRRSRSVTGQAGAVSLPRALSKLGYCSRKEAVRLIEAGRVTLEGRPATLPSLRADPGRSRIAVDGVPVGSRAQPLVIALHKPTGFITSRVDPAGRPTVYDLLHGVPAWVFPVGRLDRDTSGLLVLTNDHGLGHRLTDPESHVSKTYHVLVRGIPDGAALRALREGGPLPDGTVCRPAQVRSLGATRGGTWLEIVLTEGKNRQVRKMCRSVGHDVKALARVRIGGLGLGRIPPGGWRRLSPASVAKLLRRPS